MSKNKGLRHFYCRIFFLATLICLVVWNCEFLGAIPSKVKVEEFAKAIKASVSYPKKDKIIKLSLGANTLEFQDWKSEVFINGTKVALRYPVVYAKKDKAFFMQQSDIDNIILPILDPKRYLKNKTIRKIALDAGHGGRDNGTENKVQKLKEKDVNLNIILMLKDLLEKDRIEVILTRSGDTYMGLENRSEISNKRKADVFISVHCNAVSKNPSLVKGVETYVMKYDKENDKEGLNSFFAYCVQSSLRKSLGTDDRGVRRANFSVLRKTECPAILVESSFLSHPSEGKKLGTNAYQQLVAKSIHDGIKGFKNTVDRQIYIAPKPISKTQSKIAKPKCSRKVVTKPTSANTKPTVSKKIVPAKVSNGKIRSTPKRPVTVDR